MIKVRVYGSRSISNQDHNNATLIAMERAIDSGKLTTARENATTISKTEITTNAVKGRNRRIPSITAAAVSQTKIERTVN